MLPPQIGCIKRKVIESSNERLGPASHDVAEALDVLYDNLLHQILRGDDMKSGSTQENGTASVLTEQNTVSTELTL